MNRFPKARRLMHRAEYDSVFNHSRKIVLPDFIFFYQKNEKENSRLGLVIAKKKIAKAHDRNRVKRLLRETFRNHLLPAIDVVVLARKEVARLNNDELLAQMGIAWQKMAR